MHRLRLAVIAAAFLLGSTCAFAVEDEPNAAERAGGAVKDAAEATGHAVKEGAEAAGDAVKGAAETTGETLGLTGGQVVEPTAAEVAEYEKAVKAMHEMSGTIAKVDRESGTVDLKTEQGDLRLHFPPASVASLKDGEKLIFEVALLELPVAQGGTRAYDAPAEDKVTPAERQGVHWMKGKIDNIDRAKGTFDFKTGGQTLNLHLPPGKIATLENGDAIAIELSFAAAAKAM